MTQAKEVTKMDEKEAVGYAYNFQVDLGNGTAFSITGNFAKGAEAKDMNGELDKLRSVTNRQQAKSAVIAIEQEIMKMNARLESSMKDLEAVDKRQADKKHVSEQDRNARTQHAANIEHQREAIAQTMDLLTKTKKEAE